MMLQHRWAMDMMMIHGRKLEWRHLDYHLDLATHTFLDLTSNKLWWDAIAGKVGVQWRLLFKVGVRLALACGNMEPPHQWLQGRRC